MRDNMTFNELILTMNNLVLGFMTGYHTDFYCYDAAELNKHKDDPDFNYTWFMRDTGTDLIKSGDPISEILKNANSLEYRITRNDDMKFCIERISS